MQDLTSAIVIADSVSDADVRITSVEIVFPRIILSQVNTHRMFSRSTASSRAIPVRRMLEKVVEQPFVPSEFGSNRRGMQAGAPVDDEDLARQVWSDARDAAAREAERLAAIGVHKQHANRLLEPFSWARTVITSTEWANFFALRCHDDPQPEFQRLARLIRDAMEASKPVERAIHLPYIAKSEEEHHMVGMICAARCARVSYSPPDGAPDLARDIKLAKDLRERGHMSPFEHAAVAFGPAQWELVADVQKLCHAVGGDHAERLALQAGFDGNLRGWTQHRKQIRGEAIFGSAPVRGS